MSNQIKAKLDRLRETATNLARVGGVGPIRDQHAHQQYVMDAQNALLEAMAEKMLSGTPVVEPAPPVDPLKSQRPIERPEHAEKNRKVAAAASGK